MPQVVHKRSRRFGGRRSGRQKASPLSSGQCRSERVDMKGIKRRAPENNRCAKHVREVLTRVPHRSLRSVVIDQAVTAADREVETGERTGHPYEATEVTCGGLMWRNPRGTLERLGVPGMFGSFVVWRARTRRPGSSVSSSVVARTLFEARLRRQESASSPRISRRMERPTRSRRVAY
jgi:hypothetical protein